MDRTQSERNADLFDCDLHQLSRRAERYAGDKKTIDEKKWDSVSLKLSQLRVSVRSMMAKRDRDETA